ncbi:hypothetical protein SAMN02745857_02600 [Andreprevotia lacus DSM 23236]|jgi:hypothetical protein|uniref:HPP family protein n=1 Tax=Andreprevotia lacus DSM 23236 TaxID=1121001 RepID=A0A1W1XSI7_9NEIS|nr:hypothetical protein [Andreprevotia lacus]SMC26812.1 hypothetical protein SAMN02745857_02600 [Andreprevotia lacus DSM 23236]
MMTERLALMGKSLRFAVPAALAAVLLSRAGQPGYLPPLLATAALLANAGLPAIRATGVAYLLCVLAGLVLHALWPASLPALLAGAVAVFVILQALGLGHPPALAMLGLLALRGADMAALLAIAAAVAAMALATWGLSRLPAAVAWQA